MSKAFRDHIGEDSYNREDVKNFCKLVCEPGSSKTEQAHKKECDINNIIRKYDKAGLILQSQEFEDQVGNVTGVDFKTAMDLVTRSQQNFEKFPSHIRKRFKNSPEEFLKFMDDSNNRDEAIKLGLIKREWTPETDGLGEHVPKDGNVNKTFEDSSQAE